MAPLFATVWGMTAMRELLNEWDNSFVRFDYCMDGRAHNREMAVWTTLPMDDFGQVCAHPHPHPEGLPARNVRRAPPPTPSVVYAVLEAAVIQRGSTPSRQLTNHELQDRLQMELAAATTSRRRKKENPHATGTYRWR